MRTFRYLLILIISLFPVSGRADGKLKVVGKRVVMGETLKYKASWGFLTIGSCVSRIDKQLFKIGPNVCYKIDIAGRTNGIAKLFYVRDSWQSYLDTATVTTHRSFRSIREGRYEMDEIIHFDQPNRKAEVKVWDKKSKSYVLKKIYDTPENIRDVVAGFMVFRLLDLSKYTKGEVFTVNGFYEDEGYSIKVVYQGMETIKTEKGKVLCYKVKPIVPKNHVFDGRDAVDVWLSVNAAKTIIRIRARMFVGNVLIELQN